MANGIRINLDTASKQQLISEVERLKNQLESKNISLKINDNNIKNQIESMRVILDSLSNNTKPIDIKFDSIKAKEDLAKIKGSFENIISEYSKLGNIKVTQNFDDQGQLESFVVKLEQVNGLVRQLKYGNSGEGLFTFLSGTEKNNINEVVNSLEKFKSKYQSVLDTIKDTKLIDSNKIENMQSELNSLNLDNFKDSSFIIKNNIDKLSMETTNLIKDQQKLTELMSKAREKSDLNNLKRQQQEQEKLNKTLEQEYKDRQKIQEAIAKTVAKREQENKTLEKNQAKAINKNLEKEYKEQQQNLKKVENIVNKYEKSLNSLKSKFGSIIPDNKINSLKSKMQGLYTSSNLKGDTNSIDNEIEKLKKLALEITRIKTLGKNLGGFDNIGINMDSNFTDIEKFINSISGAKASISSINNTTDRFGNNLKTVNYTIDEGAGVASKYRVVIDENTKSLYKMSTGLKTLNSNNKTFASNMLESVKNLVKFSAASVGVYEGINLIKSAIQNINDVNKSQTNLRMVTGMSSEEVKEVTKEYTNLAEELHVKQSEVLNSAEEFLRAGSTVEESKNLVKAATMGSVLSGQDSKTVTDQLIAISNGFKMNTKDAKELMSVIDKLTLTDNESASSFAEIATAMQGSSNMAQSVKVDFDHLLSYISTVSEVTRENASSIGQSFAAQFARFQNVKGGKDFDPYSGEDISDVNRDLKTYAGIDIRSDMETFKSYETVIDELSKKWGDLDEVGRAAIAKAMAGTEHAEEFQVLMNNMDKVNEKYDKLGTQAQGYAEKQYKIYDESTLAKIQDFTNSLSSLYQASISSDTINSALKGMTAFINYLDNIATSSKTTKLALAGLVTTIILLVKNFKALSASNFITYFRLLPQAILETKGATTLLSMAFKDLKLAIVTLLTNPVTLFIAALGIATYAIGKHIQKQSELKAKTEELKTSYQSLTQAIKDNSAEELKSSLEPFNKQQNELKTLQKQKQELEKKINNEPTTGDPRIDSAIKNADINKLKDVNSQISDLNKELKDAGVSTDKVSEAQSKLKNIEMLQKYEDEASAQKKKNDAIIDEINEYQELNGKEEKNATTKERMSQLSESLSKSIKGLVITRDSEGDTIITNTGLLDSNIKMLKEENKTVETSAKVKMEKAKESMVWQENETTVAYSEIRKRMQMYQIEAEKLQNIAKQGGNEELSGIEAARAGAAASREAKTEQNKLKELDDVFNSVIKTTDSESDLSDELEKNKQKTEENTEAQEKQERTINAVKEALEQYEYQLKVIDNLLQKQENYTDSLAKGSQKRRDAMLEEISLLKEQINIYGEARDTADKYSNSLSTISGIGGSGLAKQVVIEAEKYLGTPYVWGGESPQSGFDCSGLVQYVYSRVGVELNRTSQEQFKQGIPVQKSQLQTGDLVFFKSSGTSSAPGHVGIYAGEGKYIQAPKTGDVIKVSDLSARSDYVGARRVLPNTSSSTVDSLIAQNVTYADIIKKASETFGVAESLIAAVIKTESGWDSNAISSAGAKGLMQLMDATASELGVTDSFNPYQNIMGGTKYLAELINKYGKERGIALYNTGEYGGGSTSYANKVLGYESQYSSGKLEVPDTEVLDALSASQEFQNNVLDYENSIESKEQKIKEIYKNIYEDNITQFDNQIKAIDSSIEKMELIQDIDGENDNAYITNLKQTLEATNSKIAILQKEKAYIDEQIKNSDQLYDEATIQEMQEKSVELINTIVGVQKAVKEVGNSWAESKLNNITERIQTNLTLIENELNRLENAKTVDLNSKLILQTQKVIQDQQYISELTALLRELNEEEQKTGSTYLFDKIKEINAELDKTKSTLVEDQKAIEDIKDSVSELASTVTDKIKQVIQKNNEIYKEELEKNKKLFTDAIDDEIEKLDEAQKKLQNNETNQENISNVVELQKQLNALDLRNDDEAKAKKAEIQKELDEANKKLREDTQNQNIEARKDALNKAKSDYEELIESYNESIDASNTDEVINKQASQALINGYLVDSEGNKIDLETALLNFEDRFGEGLTAIGNKIKTELIDQLKEVKNLLNEFGTLDSTKINAIANVKNVYGKGVDLENAKAILGTKGYNYIDTNFVSPADLEPKKGDISLGGAIPSNLLNGATNLTGADRYKTEQMIQMYSDSTNGKYSTVANYNDDTLNEYIKQKSNEKGTVYASGTDLENAKKYLSSFGYSFIDTTDVSKMNLTSKDVVVGGVGVMKGISEALEANATWLWGMNRTETEQDIISYAKKLINYPINTTGFADGGTADFTGFTMVHGSKSRPETVLNYEQGENLHSFLTDIPALSKNVMDQVYNRFAGIGKFNPLKLQMDTGGSTVNNNSIQFNVDKMQGTTEEARSFANKAMNFIRKQG